MLRLISICQIYRQGKIYRMLNIRKRGKEKLLML
nr:MAG TPA: hypothetical protein [Bacteriophage sp.]